MSRLLAMLPLLTALFATAGTHWSHLPSREVDVPRVKRDGRVNNAVDRFLLRRLEAEGLGYAPEASRESLIRRVTLDLLGLPPTPAEVDAYVRDVSPGAWERLVERLMASPQFGERFGRHWLDAAGYVDVRGMDNDAFPYLLSDGKWRYRDYVIGSFNRDKPWPLFLREQVAGDSLVDWRRAQRFTPGLLEPLVATGFLVTTADETSADELNTPDWRYRVLHGTTEVFAENLLGMTLRCARCHDHKYEPITQRDYYSLAAFFSGALNPHRWLSPGDRAPADIPVADRAEIDAHNEPLDQEIEKLRKRRRKVGENRATKRKLKGLEGRIAELERRKRSYGRLQVLYDVGPAPQMHVLMRGDIGKGGPPVAPGLPAVLGAAGEDAWRGSAGARVALVNALTTPGSQAAALVARVQVNRVWQHLFGTGLVATSDNLGLTGEKPSHPDLLEWLARRFTEEGGHFKSLVRYLVNSAAYRQSTVSRQADVGLARDPGTRLLWRMPLRRMESEVVRDSVLAVSGQLDRTMGGAPVMTRYLEDGRITIDERRTGGVTNAFRRSVYVFARRNYHLTLLEQFDQPIVATLCARRSTSATVTQSLTLLNDETVLRAADDIARRVELMARSPDTDVWLDQAWRLLLGRLPDPVERRWTRALFDRHVERGLKKGDPWTDSAPRALAHVCHMLLNSSEFLYRH